MQPSLIAYMLESVHVDIKLPELTLSRSSESSSPISNSRNKTPSSDSFSISVMFRNNLQHHSH